MKPQYRQQTRHFVNCRPAFFSLLNIVYVIISLSLVSSVGNSSVSDEAPQIGKQWIKWEAYKWEDSQTCCLNVLGWDMVPHPLLWFGLSLIAIQARHYELKHATTWSQQV